MRFFRLLRLCYRRNKRTVLKWTVVALHAFLLVALSYYLWNRPVSFGEELSLLKKIYTAGDVILGNKTSPPQDAILINVSYDRVLVPVYDGYGIPMGNIDITDRGKLAELFRILAASDSYKYIVCDIFLDRELASEDDHALERQIAAMPRAVFPHHSFMDGENSTLAGDKSVYASYIQTFLDSDFTKYRYLFPGGEPSIALRMWSEINGGTMTETRWRYRIDRSTAINSVILVYPFRVSGMYDANGNKQIFNMGEDILAAMSAEEIAAACRDKIVLIGNYFEEDIHNTAVGRMPGVLIHYNAYLCLKDGRPKLPAIFFIMLFTVFLLMGANIVFRKEAGRMLEKYNPIARFPLLRILATFVGYGAGMTLICILSYVLFGVYIDVLVLALWFTLLHGLSVFPGERRDKKEI